MFIMKYCNSLHFISPALLSNNKGKRKEKSRTAFIFMEQHRKLLQWKGGGRTNLRQNEMTTTTIMETDDRRDDMENSTANGETELNPWPYIKDHFG